jgi:hypothetical protein
VISPGDLRGGHPGRLGAVNSVLTTSASFVESSMMRMNVWSVNRFRVKHEFGGHGVLDCRMIAGYIKGESGRHHMSPYGLFIIDQSAPRRKGR